MRLFTLIILLLFCYSVFAQERDPTEAFFKFDTRNSPGSPSIDEQKLLIGSPIYKSDTDSAVLTASAGRLHFGQKIFLDSNVGLPTDLYQTELGLRYSQKRPGYRTLGLRTQIGSAGDQLYKNVNEINLNFQSFYGFPSESGGFWILSVFVSNNGPFVDYFPVPGFMYVYRTPTFTGLFGLPVFSLKWNPNLNWSFQFGLLGPSFSSEVAYGEARGSQHVLSLNWNGQSYTLNDRSESKDRLTLEEKKWALGWRTLFLEKYRGEVKIGTAFDRSTYIGDGFRNMRRGSAKLDNEAFLALSIKTDFE